jgi:hypothetical protein
VSLVQQVQREEVIRRKKTFATGSQSPSLKKPLSVRYREANYFTTLIEIHGDAQGHILLWFYDHRPQ